MIGGAGYDLLGSEDAIFNEAPDPVVGDAEPRGGFGHCQPRPVLLGGTVGMNSLHPPQRADTVRGPGFSLASRHSHSVQRGGDILVRPSGRHAPHHGERLFGRAAAVLAGLRLADPQLRVLAASPMDRQDDLACRLIDIGNDVGDKGAQEPLARAHGHARGVPCGIQIVRQVGEVRRHDDRKLCTIEKPSTYPLLEPLIGDAIDMATITSQWTELMRLRASIEVGAVMPSVILRKLAAAGAGNALSRALRALGRIERSLFTLQWLSDPDLRQRSHAGLNKGEASNSLRRAVFFHRQGEIRDRTFENQSFRASGLSLITAAIVHWNTVYLDRAVQHLRAQGIVIRDSLLAHVAPLGWEHIALTGDYVWPATDDLTGFRPLREVPAVFLSEAA